MDEGAAGKDRPQQPGWLKKCAALQDPALYRLDPELAWKRLKPRTSSKKFLAMLAAHGRLARTRGPGPRHSPRPGAERRSPDRNRRPSAGNAEALERIRAVPKGFANSRLGKGLMEALAAGAQRAAAGRRGHTRRPAAGASPRRLPIDLLKTLLRLRAEAAGVAPRLIANAEDIERLAADEDEGVAALSGWRAEVFGNDAKLLRKGDLAIALENGEAVVVELEGDTCENFCYVPRH